MSVCQSCPASVIPIGSPFSMMFERITTTERARLELLIGEVQHAVSAEGLQNGREVRVAQELGEVEAPDRRSQDVSRRLDRRHVSIRVAVELYCADKETVT